MLHYKPEGNRIHTSANIRYFNIMLRQIHKNIHGDEYYDEDFHKWLYEGASWVGAYKTIHHDAVYKDKEVTKVVGQKCSTCGATK